MKNKQNVFLRMVKEKCPKCGNGDVFLKNRPFFSLPEMKDDCDVCRYHFNREPGYFLGAMYISYGLAVFEGIVTFVLCSLFLPGIETLYIVLVICAVILLLSMRNYRWSRVVYMYIFPG